jgi:NAD(P)H dehydrogenase (quinone)
MKILNILSSHYQQSFNSVLMNTFNDALIEKNHKTEIIDLYNINFNPVMRGDDFNQFFNKPLSAEIIDYQKRIKEAEILTFFYPVWWNDMPAIMKGWVDRVFAKDFAYNINDEIASGLLSHIKKVILVCTLGNNEKETKESGIENAMRLKEELGVFRYSGIENVEHHFLYDVYGDEVKRNNYLKLMQKIAYDL